MQDYRKLHVWRKAHALTINVRDSVRWFPRSGYSELKSQMTRSAESIATNIVEGCGAQSPMDFARFLAVSIKSATEMEYQLLLARDYSVMNATNWKALTDETVAVRKMLYRLRTKVIEADTSGD